MNEFYKQKQKAARSSQTAPSLIDQMKSKGGNDSLYDYRVGIKKKETSSNWLGGYKNNKILEPLPSRFNNLITKQLEKILLFLFKTSLTHGNKFKPTYT